MSERSLTKKSVLLQVGVKFYVCDTLARKTYDIKYLTINLVPFSVGVLLGLTHRRRYIGYGSSRIWS